MVLERIRRVYSAARRPFLKRRWAALCLGTVVGVGSALAVDAVAPAGFEAQLAIALGVGGSAYYGLHFGDPMIEGREPFQRGFLRVLAVIWLVDLVTVDDVPFREEFPDIVAVAGILLFLMYTVAVDIRQRTDGTASTSESPGNE